MAMKRYDDGNSVLLTRSRHHARERYWAHFNRDTHPCQSCGATDVPLEVHHRDGDPLNNLLVNLIAICHACHRSTHKMESTVTSVNNWKDDVPGSE